MTRRSQYGAALIELALILPLLLLLTFLATEFGRAVYEYNLLTKSVRDAARYLSVQVPDTHLTEARNLVVYGTIAPGDATMPLAPGLTIDHVEIPLSQQVGSMPVINTVTVRVTGYQFTSLFTSIFGHTFGPFSFSDISATMRGPMP